MYVTAGPFSNDHGRGALNGFIADPAYNNGRSESSRPHTQILLASGGMFSGILNRVPWHIVFMLEI